MCGVLGVLIKNFNQNDCELVKKIFIQSMIRGKHATGVSYVKNNVIHTIKEPVPVDIFLSNKKIEDWVNEDGNLYCIGHVRYSTSDLKYNQPISNDVLSIVHNGVITQESPETWELNYGYKTDSRNDSELVLRCLESGNNPILKFPDSSMSVCMLENNKKITGFRNGLRPLYVSSTIDKNLFFTSTKDIMKRSGIISEIYKLEINEFYSIDPSQNFKIDRVKFKTKQKDLQ